MNSDNGSGPGGITDILKEVIREAVIDAIKSTAPAESKELLEPDELAAKLKVPVSWVYEQSRLR